MPQNAIFIHRKNFFFQKFSILWLSHGFLWCLDMFLLYIWRLFFMVYFGLKIFFWQKFLQSTLGNFFDFQASQKPKINHFGFFRFKQFQALGWASKRPKRFFSQLFCIRYIASQSLKKSIFSDFFRFLGPKIQFCPKTGRNFCRPKSFWVSNILGTFQRSNRQNAIPPHPGPVAAKIWNFRAILGENFFLWFTKPKRLGAWTSACNFSKLQY